MSTSWPVLVKYELTGVQKQPFITGTSMIQNNGPIWDCIKTSALLTIGINLNFNIQTFTH